MEHFIKNIDITNFKSIRHAEIKDCRRVNVFVGPPNVGKSNILEALSLFSIDLLSEVNNFTLADLVRIKEFSQAFLFGNIRNPLTIILNNSLYIQANYEVDNLIFKAGGTESLNENILSIDQTIKSNVFPIFKLEVSNLDSNLYSDKAKSYSSNKLEKNSLKQRFPFKKYLYNKEKSSEKGISLQLSLKVPYGQNLPNIVFQYDEVKSFLQGILRKNGLKLSLDVSSNTLKIVKQLNDDSIFLNDFDLLADSLKRLTFFLSAVLSNNKSVLLFEEPEAHCYEPYILELTNTIKRDQNGNQFFIVTHSQYVIEELIRDEGSRNDTNIYMVGLENNETQIKLLSQEMNKEIYQTGLNVFFNYESLWNEISEHEAVH